MLHNWWWFQTLRQHARTARMLWTRQSETKWFQTLLDSWEYNINPGVHHDHHHQRS